MLSDMTQYSLVHTSEPWIAKTITIIKHDPLILPLQLHFHIGVRHIQGSENTFEIFAKVSHDILATVLH